MKAFRDDANHVKWLELAKQTSVGNSLLSLGIL